MVALPYTVPDPYTQANFDSLSAATVTTTGTPAAGNLTKFSGAGSITNGDLSGDVATSGTLVTTIVSIPSAATAVTQSPGDSSTKVATTAFVAAAISSARYGQFYDTTTQVAVVASTAYAVTFNTTVLSNGISIGSPTSRIVVDRTATYFFAVSAQFLETGGTGSGSAWYWYRVNGVDETYSASVVSVSTLIPAQHMADTAAFALNAGDYVEIMWATDDTNIQLAATGASAPVPGIPSITLSVNSIG